MGGARCASIVPRSATPSPSPWTRRWTGAFARRRRRVGRQRAAELLLLGKPFDAATAERFGLVNRVVEEAVLLSEARALARALAQQPSGALLATRRLLRGDPEQVRARIEAEARIFATQLQSEEFRAAVRALLAKGRAG